MKKLALIKFKGLFLASSVYGLREMGRDWTSIMTSGSKIESSSLSRERLKKLVLYVPVQCGSVRREAQFVVEGQGSESSAAVILIRSWSRARQKRQILAQRSTLKRDGVVARSR